MGRKRAPAILLLLLSAVGGPAASAQEKPPRPLDALPTRVVGDDLQVQYKDFRLGISERVPV